ncbi:hypothetical protein PENARI_c020G00492 [Penicillium arizonense]|uniref:Uncharacterized protein n=1 Tax=Penicillium arizonense TaxID=1835702 RepID=A0A1F5L9C4_PENAI|nr:hypothetical protein PENARI_c020G00492 [Penicillium arizonense]OGE49590.1 hypothetical protein PENARI_c020G00492 [Penicillium arizonense]
MAPTFMKLLMALCMAGSYAAGSSLEQATKGVNMKSSPNVLVKNAPLHAVKPTAVTATQLVAVTTMEAAVVSQLRSQDQPATR